MNDRPDPIDLMNRRLMNLPGTVGLIGRGIDTCEALREALYEDGFDIVDLEDIAGPVAMATGSEVDGDGDALTIVLEHLDSMARVFIEVRRRFPEVDAWLRDEYAYGDPWVPVVS